MAYLTIIIPAYKEEKTLPKLLRSIFSSGFKDFEVIVGDDASPTSLKSTVGPKFSQKNLKWATLKKNRGPAAARNEAAKQAKGEVLVFFDADVTLYPDTLEKIASYFKKDPDLNALTGVWDKEQKTKSLFPQYKALRDWSYWINERDQGEYYYLFSTRVAAIKKGVFERLGGFNESFRQMEDVELTYRIARRYAIIFTPDVRVHHEFEGFGVIARKYFWRSFYWSKLYRKRRKFDPVATTVWEMLTALGGVLALPLAFLGFFFKPFFLVGGGLFLAHLFLLRKFLRFVLGEKGLFFTLYSIAAGLVLYYFITAGAVWSYLFAQKKKLKRLKLSNSQIALLLFGLVFFVGSLLSPDYGISWDEPNKIFSGGLYLNFIRSGFDRSFLNPNDPANSFFGGRFIPEFKNLAHHPPVPNILASVLAYHFEFKLGLLDTIISFHLASVFFLSLATAVIYLFARLLSLGKPTSLFVSLSFWLYPHLFGHGHSNIKDITQASLFLTSLYFLVKAVLKKKPSLIFLGAFFLGLAFDTKFNAVYIPIIWNLWAGIGILTKKLKINWRWVLKANLTLVLIGWLTIYLFWPFLWDQPLKRIQEVVSFYTGVGKGFYFFFNAKIYQNGARPLLWYYPFVYYLIVTPPLILVLALIGLIGLMRRFLNLKNLEFLVLLIWFLPLFRAFLPKANLYDGIRHFLEVSPAIFLLSGFGLQVIQKFLKRYSLGGVLLSIACFLILVNLVWVNASLHPYQTAYHNFLVGGVKGAQDRFDIDLEGLSAKEAMEILHREKGRVKVYFPLVAHLARHYLLPGDKLVGDVSLADYVVIINKKSHTGQKNFQAFIKSLDANYPLFETVERRGGEIARIYKITDNSFTPLRCARFTPPYH